MFPTHASSCRRLVARSLGASLGGFLWLAAGTAGLTADGPEPASSAERVRELLTEQRWEQALAEAETLYAASPDDLEVAAALGAARFRAGLLDEVGPLLSPLADGDDVPAQLRLTLARLRAAEGSFEEAGRLLEQAVASAPDDRDVLFSAGDLVGDRALAVELLERYLVLSEGDDPDRIESVRGTIDLFTELGDRSIWTSLARPERVELPLTTLWDGSGRIQGFVVEARIGPSNKPVRLLLDTGSSGLFLVSRIARKRGFEPLADKTLFGGGGKRRHATERGLFESVSLGGLQFGDALATSAKAELDPTGRFHGLLGITVFAGYVIRLDLDEGLLILDANDEAPEDADRSAAPGQDYWWVSGQLLVRAGTAGQPPSLFLLDTGATASVLSLDYVNRVDPERLREAAAVRGFGGGVGGARVVRGMELEFQGLGKEGRPMVAYDLSVSSRLGGVEISGMIGLDLLAGARIRIDPRGQRIFVEP